VAHCLSSLEVLLEQLPISMAGLASKNDKLAMRQAVTGSNRMIDNSTGPVEI
jgi:hypothetical protein